MSTVSFLVIVVIKINSEMRFFALVSQLKRLGTQVDKALFSSYVSEQMARSGVGYDRGFFSLVLPAFLSNVFIKYPYVARGTPHGFPVAAGFRGYRVSQLEVSSRGNKKVPSRARCFHHFTRGVPIHYALREDKRLANLSQ
jgi:hypothetical protein